MKRAISMLGAVAALAVGFLFAAPAAQAQTTPHCTDYRTINPGAMTQYPNDGHFFTCFNGVSLTSANIIMNKMFGAKVIVRDLLDQQDVKVFYFKNRAEANAYFTATAGYGSAFTSNTARCANTFGNPAGTIAIAIYQDCSFAASQPANPDYAKVTSHEKGHAFALALAKSQGNLSGPDRSPGYRALGNYDRNNIGNLGATICTIFGQIFPSALELDLTASPGQVCINTNTVHQNYAGLTAKQIHDLRAPYFVNPSASEQYADLWAEQYSILDGGIGGNSGVLTMTDNTLGANRMRCTMHVVTSFWHTLKPVGPNNPQISFRTFNPQWGCPAVTEAQQWH